MRTVYVQACIRFPLGKQGENEAVRVVWPGIVEKFRKLYGSGSFTLTAKRCGDAEAYPVAVSTEGGDVVWLVQTADVANPGSGSCELTYTVDGVVAKSKTWSTYVAASISGDAPGEPPEEPAKAWFAAIQAQIGNLDDLTTKAKASLVAAVNEAAKTGSGGGGSISMRTADGYIQYSTDGGANWVNLIALAELKGMPGKDGHTPKIAATKTGKTTSITADGVEIAQIKDGEDAAADPSLGITGAQAGQIAKITAVDASGVPTAWSPVDMASGDSLGAVLYTPQNLTDEQKRHARENIEALSNNSVYYTYLPNNHNNDIYKLALSGPIGFITGQGAPKMIPPITVIFGAINRGVIDAFAIDIGGNMYNTSLNLMGMPEPVWTKIEQLRLNNNGALPQQTMASSPTENMQIATKKYVDDHATGGGGSDPSLGITGATVGQIAKITAVDNTGKPTTWSPVDMPSVGGHWETVLDTVWEQDVINPTAYDSGTGIFTCAEGELNNLELNKEYVFFQQCVKEGVAYNTILNNENLKVTKLSDTTFSIDATPPATFVPTNVKFSRGACLAITDIDARKIRITLDGQFNSTATLYDRPFYGINVPFFGRNTGYQQIRNAYQAYQQVTAEVESPYRIVGKILCGFNAPSSNANFHFKNNSFCCPLIPSDVPEGNARPYFLNFDGTKIAKLYSTSAPHFIGTAYDDQAILNDYLKIISGTKVKLERWVE